MASSDTIVLKGVTNRSFVINRDSAIANKEIIDAMYKNEMKKYMGGGKVKPMQGYKGGGKVMPIMVGADEAIMPPKTVNKYGMGFMMALNQKPKAHESIDSLIAASQLENMKNFARGGYVTARGMSMKRPKGGSPTAMLGYEHGGMKKDLKEIPSNNPGLSKLPEMVRNRMGYMKDGGYVNNYQEGGNVDADPLMIDERMANASMYAGNPMFGAGGFMPRDSSNVQITPEMIQMALMLARQSGEQVQPERIEMSNEQYPLQLLQMMNR